MKKALAVLAATLVLATLASAGDISGKVSGVKGSSVVWVSGGGAKATPSDKRVTIDQKGLMFQPHITVVPVGSTVDFLNSDSVAHNVFWPAISGDKKAGHNLGTWPQGQKKSFKFDQAGVVPLLCNVHPEMAGYLVVTPTSYFAETDASGNYKIANVPDGQYTVTAWHEGAKEQSKPVKVAGSATQDFTLSK